MHALSGTLFDAVPRELFAIVSHHSRRDELIVLRDAQMITEDSFQHGMHAECMQNFKVPDTFDARCDYLLLYYCVQQQEPRFEKVLKIAVHCTRLHTTVSVLHEMCYMYYGIDTNKYDSFVKFLNKLLIALPREKCRELFWVVSRVVDSDKRMSNAQELLRNAFLAVPLDCTIVAEASSRLGLRYIIAASFEANNIFVCQQALDKFADIHSKMPSHELVALIHKVPGDVWVCHPKLCQRIMSLIDFEEQRANIMSLVAVIVTVRQEMNIPPVPMRDEILRLVVSDILRTTTDCDRLERLLTVRCNTEDSRVLTEMLRWEWCDHISLRIMDTHWATLSDVRKLRILTYCTDKVFSAAVSTPPSSCLATSVIVRVSDQIDVNRVRQMLAFVTTHSDATVIAPEMLRHDGLLRAIMCNPVLLQVVGEQYVSRYPPRGDDLRFALLYSDAPVGMIIRYAAAGDRESVETIISSVTVPADTITVCRNVLQAIGSL